MIALVSSPCLSTEIIPCNIGILKKSFEDKYSVTMNCFYYANEFELFLLNNYPYLYEYYDDSTEIGYDFQNPYFAAFIFKHKNPEKSLKKSLDILYKGKSGLPLSLDDQREINNSSRLNSKMLKKEFANSSKFCKVLKQFCDEKTEELSNKNYSLICFSSLSSQLFVSLYISSRIKKINPLIKTVMGGGILDRSNVHIYAKVLPYIDHFIIGRDENRISNILDGLHKRTHKAKIYITAFNKKKKSNTYPDYSDAKHILDHKQSPSVSVTLSNSNGCSWGRCCFCATSRSKYNDKYWCPEKASKYIEELVIKNGIASIDFAEWEINTNPSKLMTLCSNIKKTGMKLNYWGEFSPAECSRDLFSNMTKCGRWSLQMGIESFSDGLLTIMNKRQKVVDNIKAIKLGIEEGISMISFNLIYGYPKTNVQHLKETLYTIRKIKHLLSNEIISISIIPFYKHRRNNNVKGSFVETHYLPRKIQNKFPTQLVNQSRSIVLFDLWEMIENEIESIDSSYCYAFDTRSHLVIEDNREYKQVLKLKDLKADLFRVLLDDAMDISSISDLLMTEITQIKTALKCLEQNDLLHKSNDGRYIAIPIKG